MPYVSGTNVTTGIVTNNISYRDVGVLMTVTPKISPDGKVIMRVKPEVSSVAPTTINLGNGILASAFNVQTVDTTVIAQDGETVAIGGLITKKDQKLENKIPWFGDLPGVGSLFRYRTQTKSKTELLVIMTPHIVRSRWEADRILAEESRRMSWCLGDVTRMHGISGMEPLFPGFGELGERDSSNVPVQLPTSIEPPPAREPQPLQRLPQPLPQGQKMPAIQQQGMAPRNNSPTLTPQANTAVGSITPANAVVTTPPLNTIQRVQSPAWALQMPGEVISLEQPDKKEAGKWNFFRK